jgi:hypothetical protein
VEAREAREAREAKEVREAVEVMAVMSTTADIAVLESEGGWECQADEEEGREEREDEMEGEVVDKIFTTSKHIPEMYELPFTGTIPP